MNIWKHFLIIAAITSTIQWILFFLDFNLTENINFIILPQAICWTVYSIVCFYKFKKS
jgi:hypothetical protein